MLDVHMLAYGETSEGCVFYAKRGACVKAGQPAHWERAGRTDLERAGSKDEHRRGLLDDVQVVTWSTEDSNFVSYVCFLRQHASRTRPVRLD